jgi:hypothetical protein
MTLSAIFIGGRRSNMPVLSIITETEAGLLPAVFTSKTPVSPSGVTSPGRPVRSSLPRSARRSSG